MPVISVETNDWGDLLGAVARLIVDPKGIHHGQKFDDAYKGELAFLIFSSIGMDRYWPTDEDLRLIHAPSQVTETDERAWARNIEDAFIAGQILIRVLRLEVHEHPRASVENAIKIVSFAFAKANKPASRSKLMALWSKCRDVSPFAAAWFAFAKELVPHAATIASILSLQSNSSSPMTGAKKLTDDQLEMIKLNIEKFDREVKPTLNVLCARYFGFAEKFRIGGEKHFSHGQKARAEPKPCLNPKTTWLVPPQFQVAQVEIEWPPLTADEREGLEQE
jgi:hypothetical protein